MKLWFTKKTPKDLYDGKAPYDATVEQVLRVAQEVNAAPAEAERDTFDFTQAFRARGEPAPAADMPLNPVLAPSGGMPRVSLEREEMQRRVANYRAFQLKLNEEREARIRRTMDDVRAKLKQSAPPSHPSR